MYNSFSKTFRKYIKMHFVGGQVGYDHFYESLPAKDVYEWCKYIEARAKERSFRQGVNLGIVCTTILWVIITLFRMGG